MSLENHGAVGSLPLCFSHVSFWEECRQSSTKIVLLLSELFLYADYMSGIFAIKKHQGYLPLSTLALQDLGDVHLGPNRGIFGDLTHFHFLLYPCLHFTDKEIQVQSGYTYIHQGHRASQRMIHFPLQVFQTFSNQF